MATPTPKSYQQILGESLKTYRSKIGINDMNVGSANVSFFEAVAQAVYRATGDVFSILRDFNVDRASGEKLKRIAKDENVRVSGDKVTTGVVTIRDSSFEKIVTKIYAGANPPNQGSTAIKASDASLFTPTGSIYIGRGTPNVEGPIAYTSIAFIGGYYEITLAVPTTKFHNISESVILAQGGVRVIPSGEVVKAPASGNSPDISFTLTKQAIILDGENVITNVPVAAQKPGTDGNIPKGSIKQFSSSAPFVGAIVTNDIGFTTGKNADTDEEIKNNIKKARISRGLGTALAIRNATSGIKATDENATVSSNEIISDGETTTLYIDNGKGYEEQTKGIGLEFIVDSALGGEVNFQLSTGGRQTSVAKAFLLSNNSSPFDIAGNDRLALLVGGNLSEHVFQASDFRSQNNATAFEVVSSINANPLLTFSANTLEDGNKVVLFAKAESEEFLEKTDVTTGLDAGDVLNLPSGEVQTLRLYKNKKPLNRNGKRAQVTSEEQNNWSSTITSGDDLKISVDGTNTITYVFTDSDFLSEGSFPTVNKNNSLISWVNVINAKVTGITASINGNRIVLTSNLGLSSRASLEIDNTSTLVSKGIFTTSRGLESYGLESDFVFSRNTAQGKLKIPLEKGDSLSGGTEFTKGNVTSSPILGGTLTLSSDGYLWVLVDNKDALIISTGVTTDSTITVSKPAPDIVRYTSNNATAFSNTQVGDWVVLWSDELSLNNRLEAKVYASGANYIELRVTPAEYALASAEGPIVWREGISITRTDKAIQKIKIDAGTFNINSIASAMNEQLLGAVASVEDDEILIITTKTEENYGEVLIVNFDSFAKNLNFTINSRNASETTLFAFYESDSEDAYYPLFIHSKVTSDNDSNPPDTFISDFDSEDDLVVEGSHINSLVSMLEPYGAIKDNISSKEYTQVKDISTLNVEIEQTPLIRRLRADDRFFVSDTYQFSPDDNLVVILDGDVSNKTFPMNLFRKAKANNTMGIDTNSWRAYDIDSGATTEFEQFFGSEFKFKNYRALMKARNVIDPSSSINEDAILFRSNEFGLTGERYNIGYVYPTSPDQEIVHNIFVDSKVLIRIGLKSGSPIANTIDGTTEWNVTVTNMGAYDEVTYTWNTVGSNPTIDSALSSGGYATINNSGEFSLENTGNFRVSSATATSFTTIREAGEATPESNIATLTNTTIVLFEKSDTTAEEINTYIADNMSQYISSELVDDGGLTGAGIIDRSTEEDNDFAFSGFDLVDGENWIEISDLPAASPNYQFRFKKSLTIPSFSTNTVNAYAFNAGEEVRLIPTTSRQVVEFLNVLAVTGFTTLGEITTSNKESKIQLKTSIFGSEGIVQIAGGKANSSSAQILQPASKIDEELMRINVLRSGAGGFHAGQYIELKAAQAQKKDTGISFATTVTIVPNSPTAGKSTLTLGNRDNHDIHFGEGKNFFRDRNRTFQVERHGRLTCVSWDGVGASPFFSKNVEINDSISTISVVKNTNTGYTEYTVDAGDISFLECQRGDLFTIAGLVDNSNNGTFSVVGVSDDSETIIVNNTKGVDAAGAVLPIASIEVFAEVKEGDTVTLGLSFATLNRGTFRVIRRYKNSFYIENTNSVEQIATVNDDLRSLGFDGTTEFDVVVSGGSMVIEWNGNGTQPSLQNAKYGDVVSVGTDFAADNQGEFLVLSSGDNYIECANSLAVAEIGVVITDVLESHQPSLKFSEYDTTVAGDRFIVSGNVFDGDNIGGFVIDEVLSKNSLVLNSILAPKTNVQLEEDFIQVYIEESLKYSAYKKIYTKIIDPNNSLRSVIVLESSEQFLKVNKDAGEVFVSAIGKLNFRSPIKRGLDSYRYNTGLIGESNRVVYGDPRNSVTYAGVSAAGAEIFIKAPLKRRIQVGVGIRVNTGVPFAKITEQVRNNIAALINSSPIGVSIAISDIVSSVNSIQGVRAVSITSPSYSITNDVIVVAPSEKPLILDIVNDITISKVG